MSYFRLATKMTVKQYFTFFPGRLKVNMANIHFKQKNYPKAIKLYRMALDQISNSHKEMRIKIMQNIGVVFIRMGQYSDAITSFEHIMSESPNIKTGFNLILCYYAIGDRERMKKAFQKLICVPLGIDEEDKYIPPNVSTSVLKLNIVSTVKSLAEHSSVHSSEHGKFRLYCSSTYCMLCFTSHPH